MTPKSPTLQPDSAVRDQYEKFPYPPISVLALPKKNQGKELKYELGRALAQNPGHHRGIRILVAGAGTLEALVVAQAHPQAKEVIAVDLSQSSLNRLRYRVALAKLTRFPSKIPPIRIICDDLFHYLNDCEPFDYIIASNVIHHVDNPSRLLQKLSSQLKSGGLLRVVTYPKASRLWMRATGLWLQLNGLSPQTNRLEKAACEIINRLPENHPVRHCFETHSEARTSTGIVDAFLHQKENPLSPMEWMEASRNASLRHLGETQNETSQSGFLTEVCPETKNLSRWHRLQILDDLLEICANPILWFKKEEISSSWPSEALFGQTQSALEPRSPAPIKLDSLFQIPSPLFWEMKQGLLRTQERLKDTGINLSSLFEQFKKEVGPRVDPCDNDRILKGLALSDYPLPTLLESCPPYSEKEWRILEQSFGIRAKLTSPWAPYSIPGESLQKQAQWLEIRFGAYENSIPVKIQMT